MFRQGWYSYFETFAKRNVPRDWELVHVVLYRTNAKTGPASTTRVCKILPTFSLQEPGGFILRVLPKEFKKLKESYYNV